MTERDSTAQFAAEELAFNVARLERTAINRDWSSSEPSPAPALPRVIEYVDDSWLKTPRLLARSRRIP